jgi:hypothetical protein
MRGMLVVKMFRQALKLMVGLRHEMILLCTLFAIVWILYTVAAQLCLLILKAAFVY